MGFLTRVLWEEEQDCTDERILGGCKDKSKIAILDPSEGELDRHCVHCQDMMSVVNAGIVRFYRLLWEGRGQESINDGVDHDSS